MACDLIIASETASFGLPEPLVGAVALGGGMHRLVRQIGLKRAMGFLLTGDRISPQQGYELGLVNEVVAAETLAGAVERWCERILRCAPLSVGATKEAAMKGLDEPSLASALAAQAQYPGFQTWFSAEDTQEGPRAFAEKREPVWSGR